MRVITGIARGRKLKELPGMETRPTTDKVKESVFNIVQFDIEGRRVLDLFAGTGQMGIEALSRGAAHCTFVDLRKEAAAVVRENLAHTKLSENGKVIQGDYLAFLTGCREKFDLAFLDPPYNTGMLERRRHHLVGDAAQISANLLHIADCTAGIGIARFHLHTYGQKIVAHTVVKLTGKT